MVGAGDKLVHGFTGAVAGDAGGEADLGRAVEGAEVPLAPALAQALGGQFGAFQVALRQHHDELLTSQPRQIVAAAQVRQREIGEVTKHPIPPAVAEGIVDRLEVIQVHVAHRKRINAAVGQPFLMFQHLQDMTPVEQAGEVIADRQVPDLFQGVGQGLVLLRQPPAQAVDAAAGDREAHAHQGKHQPLQGFQGQAQAHAVVPGGHRQHQQVADAGQHRQAQQRAGTEPERHQQQQREKQHQRAAARFIQAEGGDQEGQQQHQRRRHRQARFAPVGGEPGFHQDQVNQARHQQPGGHRHQQHRWQLQRPLPPQQQGQQHMQHRHRQQRPSMATQQTPLTDRQVAGAAPVVLGLHGGPAATRRSRPADLAW